MLFTSPMYDYMKSLPGSESAIYLIDLVKYLLRARPDIIVIGESRGREIHELIQGVLTGHGGATTFHAEDLMEVFMRLTGEAIGVSPEHLSAFHVLAVIRRFEFGRRVANISEVVWTRPHQRYFNAQYGNAVTPIRIKDEDFAIINVGWYDPRTDSVEVDLRRSFWLQRLGSEAYTEIVEREKFLRSLVERQVFDAEKVAGAVMDYYRQRHVAIRKA